MRKQVILWIALTGFSLLTSCGNSNKNTTENRKKVNKIVQKADGTISLNVNAADCYNDLKDPSGNTAEWDVIVSRTGYYNVWISSATKDTTDLKYGNPVMVNVQDTRIEGQVGCDKIIHNSTDVTYPYFRADSFIGSMYIKDTGEYNIQVISDKILPKDYQGKDASGADISKMISVSFTPETR